jgi:hypothetical protein
MEQVSKLLEKLAAQLGTTVEFLWSVLLKQAQVENGIAIFGLIIGVLILILSISAIVYAVVKQDEVEEAGVFLVFLGIGLFVISLIVMYENIITYVTTKYNPEYWALQEILKQLN